MAPPSLSVKNFTVKIMKFLLSLNWNISANFLWNETCGPYDIFRDQIMFFWRGKCRVDIYKYFSCLLLIKECHVYYHAFTKPWNIASVEWGYWVFCNKTLSIDSKKYETNINIMIGLSMSQWKVNCARLWVCRHQLTLYILFAYYLNSP
jgi:hypothetical protein